MPYTNVLIEDCEDNWDEQVVAGVTLGTDGADYKCGTKSATFAVTAGVVAGTVLASEAVTVDLSGCHRIEFWIKSDVATEAGDLQLLLDDNANCASPVESLDIPALVANTWAKVRVDLADPSACGAIISVGLNYVTDLGACNINIDCVYGQTVYPEFQRRGHDITHIFDGRKTVAAAGTAEALAAVTTACKLVIITAETDNTDYVVVGGSTVVAALATRRGTPLSAGDSVALEVDSLADVYIDSLVNGEGVTFTYMV